MSAPFNERQFQREFGVVAAPDAHAKVQIGTIFKIAGQIASEYWRYIVAANVILIIMPKLILAGMHLSLHNTKPDGDPLYDILWSLDEGVDVFGYLLMSFLVTLRIVMGIEQRSLVWREKLIDLTKLTAQSVLVVLGILLGAVLLVVPGIILFVMWGVSGPAMLREKLSIMQSLGRSRQLTKGNFWRILLVLGLAVATSFIAAEAFDALSVTIDSLWPHQHIEWIVRSLLAPWFDLPFILVPIALYYHLVEVREGLPRQAVEDIFD